MYEGNFSFEMELVMKENAFNLKSEKVAFLGNILQSLLVTKINISFLQKPVL